MKEQLNRQLLRCLAAPEDAASLTAEQWDAVIRLGRVGGLLGRLAAGIQQAGVWGRVPAGPRGHLAAALVVAQRQHTELQYEVRALAKALASIDVPVVLLKGAAYAMAGLSAGNGRTVSDVDILVPKSRLAEVETALMMAGWVSTNRDAYDQHYYRQWMHEIPPMRHIKRGAVVDLHHAILPPTSRLKPDTALLLQTAVDVVGVDGVKVLSPEDMVLHSAAHLFHEGAFDMGLRGLTDLTALLSDFSALDAGFQTRLEKRADVLDLQWPLLYALRYGRLLLGLPDHVDLEQRLMKAPRVAMSTGGMVWRDALFTRAMMPVHALTNGGLTPLARGLLYLRGHLLRMPLRLLLPHLWRKTWLGWRTSDAESVA